MQTKQYIREINDRICSMVADLGIEDAIESLIVRQCGPTVFTMTIHGAK